jgi:hypothetical protein
MEPRLDLNGLFIFFSSALMAISFTVAIVVLAMSRERWGTFKKMGLTWFAVVVSGLAVAIATGYLSGSSSLAGLLTSTSLAVASIAAVVMGILHARTVQ